MATPIAYTTDISLIRSPKFNGWCVHLLCLDGECRMTYSGRNIEFGKDSVVIITHPQNVTEIATDSGFRCIIVIGEYDFLHNQLPANHYGIGGGISLYDNPVIPLTPIDTEIIYRDMLHISQRLSEKDNPFYAGMMGSLVLTMMYDLFKVHARRDAVNEKASIHSSNLVNRLLQLLSSDLVKTHRSVKFYAAQLNVTQKYLSDTIRRQTGHSVMSLIDKQSIPLISEALKNTHLSLSQIAAEFNFSSVSYLSRYVKKHLGMTATEYRASLQPKKKSKPAI